MTVELVDVSSFFDRTVAKDPDSGLELFACQLLAYDESKRDAYTAHRRIMSTAPSVTIPSSRVVNLLGSNWMVGEFASDGWDVEHRRKYVLHRAQGRLKIYRLDGFLAGTPAVTVWGDMQWLVDKKELEVSSRVPQRFAAILPAGTDVRLNDVITWGALTMLVASQTDRVSGFFEADGMLQSMLAPVTMEVHTRTYSPSAGAYTNLATAQVPALKVRWQELYAYDDQMAERYQEGDSTWVLPGTTALTTSAELVQAGQRFTVLSIQPSDGCLLVHARLK